MTAHRNEQQDESIPKTFQEALLRWVWPSPYRKLFLVILCFAMLVVALNINFDHIAGLWQQLAHRGPDASEQPPRQAPAPGPPGDAAERPDAEREEGKDAQAVPPASSRSRWQACDVTSNDPGGFDLRGANLEGCNLSAAVLATYDLTGADLREATLTEADLTDAILHGAKLAGADLSHAVLRRADLSEADLQRADLSDADLTETDLSGAQLQEARGLVQERLVNACGDERTEQSLPPGLWIPMCP